MKPPPLSATDVTDAVRDLPDFADPPSAELHLTLARLLFAIGRRDLPLGRLAEGHVDALQIIHRYGTAEQATAAAAAAARGGRVFGVWNADQPGDPTILRGDLLSGAKAFASGAGLVSDALISVDAPGGRQLLLVDLAAAPPEVDRTWWHVIGMQRSETHRVRWADAPLAPAAWIGAPGDYVREPWFSGGAIRFAAVQAGGIAALVDHVAQALGAAGRADDPIQRARLADLYAAAQSAADAVRGAAIGWSADDVDGTRARVAAARVAVYRSGETALALAAAAVGVQAMFVDHPLAAAMTDLTVYLRQPAPDAQRLLVGQAVAAGQLEPAL